MTRLSSSIENIKDHYNVVVIGSGYGGGIAASRLARAGQQVCLLERGKEFLPGEFPDTVLEATDEMQIDTCAGHIGSKTGLFDFHVNDDMNVLVGCGLGGTSLINANVALEADPRVFEDPKWPKALIDDLKNGIEEGYKRTRTMLKVNPYPTDFPQLKKLEAMKKSAEYIKEDFSCPPIAVTFEKYKDNVNHVGVTQTPCILCGDCTSGCNYTAKNTVQMNYLPDAWNHGAEIFTETKVLYIEKQAGKWLVHFEVAGIGRDKFNAPNTFVSADIVILSAGTLGSTEILLRSQQEGLSLSDRLGKNFTGNADALGFGYNNDQKINGIGWGTREPDPENPVGPCITGLIDTRKSAKNYKEGMSIEEGVLPGALSPLLPAGFSSFAKILGKDMDAGFIDYVKEKKRELESLLMGSYCGAVNNTQTYLVMTHDSCDGIMYIGGEILLVEIERIAMAVVVKGILKVLHLLVPLLLMHLAYTIPWAMLGNG
jgi:cholesterol oxidase